MNVIDSPSLAKYAASVTSSPPTLICREAAEVPEGSKGHKERPSTNLHTAQILSSRRIRSASTNSPANPKRSTVLSTSVAIDLVPVVRAPIAFNRLKQFGSLVVYVMLLIVPREIVHSPLSCAAGWVVRS